MTQAQCRTICGVTSSDGDRVRSPVCDRVWRTIKDEIPEKVAADRAYRNAMRNSDKQNAKVEHERVLKCVMTASESFQDDPMFRKWLTDRMFEMTYEKPGYDELYCRCPRLVVGER